ncbi:MAG: dTDP-4-dehydrorhamnose 3,5-epimerase [Gemmatimonadetes bacterium]|nr:dTDP-4-dehydrorhamnose 3,5-epimerase [Gemmatimonadota bacterium]
MASFRFDPTEIPDVVRVRVPRFRDSRGSFGELFRSTEFRNAGIPTDFVQDNLAVSERGVLRGLHFQLPPSSQGKLVAPVEGRIFDVAVDLRRLSPTFRQWVGVELDAQELELLWVPPGFAHGYQVLSDRAHVLYKATAEYDPEREDGIRWNDPALGIRWPLPDPVTSAKDQALPTLAEITLPDGPW